MSTLEFFKFILESNHGSYFVDQNFISDLKNVLKILVMKIVTIIRFQEEEQLKMCSISLIMSYMLSRKIAIANKNFV